MKISQLPLNLQLLAKLRSKEYPNQDKESDIIGKAILFNDTPEGYDFWMFLHWTKDIKEARENMFESDQNLLDRILNTPKVETYTKTSCHGVDAEYPTEEGKYFCFDERNQMVIMPWGGDKEAWNKIDYWLK